MFYPTFASVSFGRLRQALSLVLACLLLGPSSPAFADLMLHPTRIVFDKNARAAQVQLINNGNKPASYRISVVNRRMTETGQIEPADTAMEGERFADDMLRYSPRQVTLQPGTAQTVRVMLRKPAELAEGEYRSHLLFDKLPDVEGSASIENRSAGDGQVGVVIQTLVGAAMPVIVRHGNLSANVSLDGLALQKDEAKRPLLALRLQREGSSSVYGDLSVTFTPRGGKPQSLAQVSGIAVFTPNRVRKAMLPLQVPPGVALAGGTIEVAYRDRPEAGGKLLAQASLALP
ncbi:fimbria/pilus periplasmic chaperone [Massilia sp. IC2-477]|uniref:fimbrial biogenesis chaperone n=1 Tax=Massilia sp. IC2-477 TaxID=2887198 RepID=UPI001D0F9809|nr:fimbria/pilus periplasmic chaperone [Massilia sp. IC2-477]MCC2956614.1 fimbria/pilus periplasmic chaperone [Massilia sp. IC2-477]